MKTWTDPNAPGWTLTLDEAAGTWGLSVGANARVLPEWWVVSSRRYPAWVWMGRAPAYLWSEGHDAHVSTRMAPAVMVFRGVFAGGAA